MDPAFGIKNTTRRRAPSLPFEDMKVAALGKRYDLSLVFCGDRLSRRLNRVYRDKDRPTNILSYPISRDSGEVFINLRKCEREAKKFERPFENFVGFLFIHGLVHLKGMDHGSKMESEESKLRRKFRI